jgi:1-acyl-sn-glycerol-3-phosphate acyltransferase
LIKAIFDHNRSRRTQNKSTCHQETINLLSIFANISQRILLYHSAMEEQQKSASDAVVRPFIPEKPSPLFIKGAQEVVRAQLASQNHLHLDDNDLAILDSIPAGSGVILAPNHADETDPRLCLELSRRSGKRFISMCNREAFDELFGLAGFVLQRLGHFSVERGAHDVEAKEHAVKVVARGEDALVIFPEGEIFYLNEIVQPFHGGAVDIGMQALIDRRKADPNWSAYIVPMAIKYHYPEAIDTLLERRVTRMESHLLIPHSKEPLPDRLHAIQKKLIERQARNHHIKTDGDSNTDLLEQIVATEKAIIDEVEERHKDLSTYQKRIIDESWQLEAELRNNIAKAKDSAVKKAYEKDLEALKEVAQLASWQPHYYQADSSPDRLAEALLKLERELYRIHRPKQLARRDVFVKLSQPIALNQFIDAYQTDAKQIRHSLTEDLHGRIQAMIDDVVAQLHQSKDNR